MVAVLFARGDSHYKALPGCDVWDAERDARRWPGKAPVIAHPPCRAWGRLRNFAKPRPDEKELARFAVAQVRQWGGVLEHPSNSTLWEDQGLPRPGAAIDEWGGWTLPIEQHWWGHRAQKATWLYIVGCGRADVPQMPMRLDAITHAVQATAGRRKGMPGWKPCLRTAEREHTPPELAAWLVDLAKRCDR